jgi:recombinational DNA repair ATPase RecF
MTQVQQVKTASLHQLKRFKAEMDERNARLRTAVFVKEWMEEHDAVMPTKLRDALIEFCNEPLEGE